MPRRRSLVTVIRDMVREQVQDAIQGLLGAVGGPKKKAKNGRRRRRRRRGPGRPPGRRRGCAGGRGLHRARRRESGELWAGRPSRQPARRRGSSVSGGRMALSTTFFRSGIASPPQGLSGSVPSSAVGRRVLVNCATVGTPVPLDGTEVEILGWKPRAAGGARYRVRTITDQSEGWLAGMNLRPVPTPTAVPPKTKQRRQR